MTHVVSQWNMDGAADDLTAEERTDAQLRKIVDALPVLAWCNRPDGSNEFLNQRWQDYTGLSQQKAAGWGWKVRAHVRRGGPSPLRGDHDLQRTQPIDGAAIQANVVHGRTVATGMLKRPMLESASSEPAGLDQMVDRKVVRRTPLPSDVVVRVPHPEIGVAVSIGGVPF